MRPYAPNADFRPRQSAWRSASSRAARTSRAPASRQAWTKPRKRAWGAFGRDLNVLSRGEETAAALGVAVGRTTAMLCAVAALATAAAVTTAGSVGFVGLVVPHGLRLVVGNDQRLLLPASVLCGGTLLVFADTLARTIAAPIQLPVGVITALVGVPVLLVLLTRIRS